MIRAVTALGQAARARQVTPVARPGRSRVRKARAGRAARVRPDRTSRKGSRGEQQAAEDDRAMRRPHIPRAGTRARCAATSESARSHRRRTGAPRRGPPERVRVECCLCTPQARKHRRWLDDRSSQPLGCGLPVACEAEHPSVGPRAAANQHQVLRCGSRCVRHRGHAHSTAEDSPGPGRVRSARIIVRQFQLRKCWGETPRRAPG